MAKASVDFLSMAHIVTTDAAPKDTVHYSFAAGEFDLVAGEKYETDDHGVIAEALTHPWLAVEYDPKDAPVPTYVFSLVDPKTDPLSAENPANSQSLDAKASAEFEAKRRAEYIELAESIANGPSPALTGVPAADNIVVPDPEVKVVEGKPKTSGFTKPPATEDNN